MFTKENISYLVSYVVLGVACIIYLFTGLTGVLYLGLAPGIMLWLVGYVGTVRFYGSIVIEQITNRIKES